jgi:hypothetical protein
MLMDPSAVSRKTNSEFDKLYGLNILVKLQRLKGGYEEFGDRVGLEEVWCRLL